MKHNLLLVHMTQLAYLES